MAIKGPIKLGVQIMNGAEPAIGPGKALVMEAIAREGAVRPNAPADERVPSG